MSFDEKKRKSIQTYLLDKIRCDDCLFIAKTRENFGVSATTIRRYLNQLAQKQIICVTPDTHCGYRLTRVEARWALINDGGLDEDCIYTELISPFLKDISEKSTHILRYAFMEIMNNALEHSKGENIQCSIRKDYLYTEISIVDNGIGIFNSIREYAKEELHLKLNVWEAVEELYKGRFTTKPENHSGEGIFFTSKLLTSFAILSENTIYSYRCNDKDEFISSHLLAYYTGVGDIGTMAVMRIENDTRRSMKEVFDMYAPLEEGFVKTCIPLKELCPFGDPVARSQARRILRRLDEFKEVIFDFKDIEFMGQGFSDEVFRVFHNQHPEVVLTVINANETVLGMIRHVQR